VNFRQLLYDGKLDPGHMMTTNRNQLANKMTPSFGVMTALWN